MLAGIDLGGTQVRVALARSDGHLVASVKTRTATLHTAQAMVDWAAAEIDRHRGREKVRSITIAAPGPIDIKRGILVNGWDKAQKVVKLKDWNDIEVKCEGDHINLKVNGVETADLHDSEKLSGIIGLQLHQGPPMEVYFRNLEIKVLKSK